MNDEDFEKIAKEQLEKIKDAIKEVVNDNKDYYIDKDYAKYFLE